MLRGRGRRFDGLELEGERGDHGIGRGFSEGSEYEYAYVYFDAAGDEGHGALFTKERKEERMIAFAFMGKLRL